MKAYENPEEIILRLLQTGELTLEEALYAIDHPKPVSESFQGIIDSLHLIEVGYNTWFFPAGEPGIRYYLTPEGFQKKNAEVKGREPKKRKKKIKGIMILWMR